MDSRRNSTDLIEPIQYENERVYGRKEPELKVTKELIDYGYDPNDDTESDRFE